MINKKLKIGLLIIFSAAVLGSAAFYFVYLKWPKESQEALAEVCFSGKCLKAEVADQPSEQTLGLMYRKELKGDGGMIFVFDREDYYDFWMKNTYIPLDIIWIGQNLKVVHIESAQPCLTDDCVSYWSPTAAKYVLETNAGFAEKNHLQVGDEVKMIF